MRHSQFSCWASVSQPEPTGRRLSHIGYSCTLEMRRSYT